MKASVPTITAQAGVGAQRSIDGIGRSSSSTAALVEVSRTGPNLAIISSSGQNERDG